MHDTAGAVPRGSKLVIFQQANGGGAIAPPPFGAGLPHGKKSDKVKTSVDEEYPAITCPHFLLRDGYKLRSIKHQAIVVEKPMANLERDKSNPWVLATAPGTSEFTIHVDDKDGVRVLVCTVGKTVLLYDARCVDDLHAMLKESGGWIELGGADEQKPAKEGTVESWGRSPTNPIKGWYGLKKGFRGRFGVYIPPLMEALGLCELEHNPKNNRMRAK